MTNLDPILGKGTREHINACKYSCWENVIFISLFFVYLMFTTIPRKSVHLCVSLLFPTDIELQEPG